MANVTPNPNETNCASCGAVVKVWASLCIRCGVNLSSLEGVPLTPALPPLDLFDPADSPTEQPASTLPVLNAMLLAAIGGVIAIPAAFQAELPGGILIPWVTAPIVEEVLKPSGVYVLLSKWPGALKNQAHTAWLAALAGIVFGLLESTIYVTVYFSDPTTQEIVLRFTVPVVLHALMSFIFGLGINRHVVIALSGGGSLRRSNWGPFIVAIAIHSVYNIAVTIIEWT